MTVLTGMNPYSESKAVVRPMSNLKFFHGFKQV